MDAAGVGRIGLVTRTDPPKVPVNDQILADASGQPLERIMRDTDRDFYLNAKEALEYGLADRIVDTV